MSETKRTISGIRWQPKGYSAEDWIASHKGVFYHAWTAARENFGAFAALSFPEAS